MSREEVKAAIEDHLEERDFIEIGLTSNMVNSGRSIYEVAKVLGHSQLKTTQRYAHLSQKTLLEAVDAAANATGMI